MSHPTTPRKCLIAAWMILALGVSWAALIATRSTQGSAAEVAVTREPAKRTWKGRVRDSTDIQSLRSHEEAVLMMSACQASIVRDQSLMQAFGQWADEAPEDAVAWLGGFPQGELHDWLTCVAATVIADGDPAQAASLLETEMTDGLPRNHAIVAVAQRWAQHDPNSAKRWLDSIEASPVKDNALQQIAVMEQVMSPVEPDSFELE